MSKPEANTNQKSDQSNDYNQMIQKFNELNQKQGDNVDVQEVKELKRQYKRTIKNLAQVQASQLSLNEQVEFLKFIESSLVEPKIRYEELCYIFKKQLDILKKDDQNLSSKINSRLEGKTKLEAYCREVQKNVQQIQDAVKTLPEEETKKREEARVNFDNSLAEVRQKTKVQEEEAKELEKENDLIRAQLQEMIKQYEEKEKDFWARVKEKEEEQKNESQKYLQRFEEMQKNAQKTIEQKLQIETQQRGVTQKKLKLQLYKSKFGEFNETLDKSHMSLIKLKEELIKKAFQLKQSEEKQSVFKTRADKIDSAILQMINKNKEAKEKTEQIKKDKEKLKAQILQLQKKLNEKNAQKNNEQAEVK